MFTRQPYTIPAAGEFLKIDARGQAVVIETMNIYPGPEDVPTFHYNSKSSQGQAMFPISTYGYSRCDEFKSLYLQGTAESAGDTVWLWVNDSYLETDIKIAFGENYSLEPGATFTKTANDAVVTFSELELSNANGDLPRRVDISVANSAGQSGIKWALNADPVQGDNALGTVLKPGINGNIGLLEVPGGTIFSFRFINQTAADPQTVNVTPYY